MPPIKWWDPPERHVEAQLVRTAELFCGAFNLDLDDDARERLGALIRCAARRIVADHAFENEQAMRGAEIRLLRALYSASADSAESVELNVPDRRLLPRPTWPEALY